MSKDFDEKDSESSSFREQILRELEELKSKRQSTESLPQISSDIQEEIEGGGSKPSSVNHLPLEEVPFDHVTLPRQTIKIDSISYSVGDEDVQHLEETKILPGSISEDFVLEESNRNATVRLEEDTEMIRPELIPDFSQEESSEGELENTVERNLKQLRSIAARVNASPLGETPLHKNIEETLDFQERSDVAVREEYDETIVAPALSTTEESPQRLSSSRRRSVTNHNRKKQDKTAKRIVGAVVSVFVLTLIVTMVVGFFYVKSSLEPINAQAKETIQVEIPEGTTTSEIGKILLKNKLIKNATVFTYYAKLKSYTGFQSGFYNLSQSMSLDELAKKLQEGGTAVAVKPTSGKILIVEGYTIDQIAAAITDNVQTDDASDKTPFTSEQFLATVQDQAFIARMVATYPNLFASLPTLESGVKYQLEGYLSPATYEYYDDTTVEQLVEKMIATTDAVMQPYYSVLPSKNLDVNAVLTLASLVEKEGATDEDRRNIASVFYNRLNSGMQLQSNIAILYAMGKLGEKTTLAEDAAIDTTIVSPYNVYTNLGLMPGPVGNPSKSSIEATVNPNKTDYLYFVADVTTGTVYFTASYEEHNRNVETYVNSKLTNP